jgi:transcriptional regulator with XRE-family HTH domain
MTVEEMEKPQSLKAADLASIVHELRGAHGWSQDTLSELSKLSLRTIQRVENGEPSNGDTRSALALAFELEDADVFNKPLHLPSPDELQAETERLKREHLTLTAQVAKSGRELVRLFEQAHMDSPSQKS